MPVAIAIAGLLHVAIAIAGQLLLCGHQMLNGLWIKCQVVLACFLQVRQALMKKVSRERVGQELEGMFNGTHNWHVTLCQTV